ncbi:CheR family methyltransferase [Chitinophagaceae bacterium LWZ2-11]
MKNRVELTHDELEDIIHVLKYNYGYDFSNYAKASFERRVLKFMTDFRIRSAYDLKFQLINEPVTFEHFVQTVTVNVTEIFRDPTFYKEIREKVIPILASYPIIKIWHAGCSTGEEVFSMCILLHEAGLLQRSKIYATDINPSNLEKARTGIIPMEYMREYTSNYIQAGGTKDFSDYYTALYNHAIIQKELRENVVFSQHNLVTDSVFNEFQLIFCRNVMIYFDKDLQKRVFELFYESLSPLGFLAIGMKESLLFSGIKKKFETISSRNKIYKRKGRYI